MAAWLQLHKSHCQGQRWRGESRGFTGNTRREHMFSSVGGQEPYSFPSFFVCFVVSGKSSGLGYHNQKIKGNVGEIWPKPAVVCGKVQAGVCHDTSVYISSVNLLMERQWRWRGSGRAFTQLSTGPVSNEICLLVNTTRCFTLFDPFHNTEAGVCRSNWDYGCCFLLWTAAMVLMLSLQQWCQQ